MVERFACSDEVEMHERMLVEAFSGGWANTQHWDGLANMRNVMLLAAHYKRDKPAIQMCEGLHIALQDIKDRHERTGRMGVTGEEVKMLRAFADSYRDFWSRQSMNLFKAACMEAEIALETNSVGEVQSVSKTADQPGKHQVPVRA